jgi:hypothetical protein
MSFRRFAETCIAGSAFALALTLATPALAQAGDVPAAPDMRPEWRPEAQRTSAAVLPDARTRDAWLRECRRRTEMYYEGYHRHRHHDKNRGHLSGYEGGYDYCEAYFDDYYRTYTQPMHAHPMMMHASPMMMAPATVTRTVSQPVEEVITEEYVPMRTRTIPQRRTIRRPLRDKRIRIAP